MKFEHIIDLIQSLSRSQGFYGRLYRDIMDLKETDPTSFEEYKKYLEEQNFSSDLDVILFFEE